MWVYQRTEANLYSVGFYKPNGKWVPESDYNDREQAARRVHFLNGGGRV